MTETATEITVGLYGKHPAFGDFVTAGLSDTAQSTLETWLHQVLPALRDGWGEGWGQLFDASPVIRFWFGAALTGAAGPLCGIMLASHDKVGRRFPLIAAVSGADLAPPVREADQTLYTTLLQVVTGYDRAAQTGAAEYAAAVQVQVAPALPEAAEPLDPTFWAVRGDGNLARLWQDVAPVDHARASAARGYLWCEGPGGAAVHVTRGLPGADVLGWLMTDAVRGHQTAPPPPEPLPEVTAPPAIPMPSLNDTDKTLPPAAQQEPNAPAADDPQMTG